MPQFKKRKCVCGFDTAGVEIAPNPVGEFFCPRCGRDIIPAKETATTEPEPEPETNP